MQRFLANCSYRMLSSSLSNVANNISCSISTDFNYKTGQNCIFPVIGFKKVVRLFSTVK